jgi:hypothetical protein
MRYKEKTENEERDVMMAVRECRKENTPKKEQKFMFSCFK